MPLFPRIERVCQHTFLAAPLNADSVVLDLGSNQGAFARAMIDRFGCRVYGAEPHPGLFEALPRLPSFTPHRVAIAGADGPLQLEIPTDRCASLRQTDKRAESVEVEGLSLDSFLQRAGVERADLLKLDIEGAELDVIFRTADETLARFDQITIEFHDFLFPDTKEATRSAIGRLEALGFVRVNFSLDNTDVLFLNGRTVKLDGLRLLLLRHVVRNRRGAARRLRRWMGDPNPE